MLMNRKDYKAVKHMDKQQLTEYLQRLYRRGYDAGLKAGMEHRANTAPAPSAENTTEE